MEDAVEGVREDGEASETVEAVAKEETPREGEEGPEKRVGFRGWLRGTAQKGVGVVNNVIWTAGNAKALAGQGLSQVLHRGNAGFKDYLSLAAHLENLIQADKGKARIESVHYLSDILKYVAPNYESLAQTEAPHASRLSTGEAGPPVLNIDAGAASGSPLASPRKKASEEVKEEERLSEPPVSLEDNPLKSLASVSVPARDMPDSTVEADKGKNLQGVREVFLSSKALELAGLALMKCKPASEWENVAYRDLFVTSVLLDPQSKDFYCECLLKTACKISEVWETLHMQSNEGNDSSAIKEVVEKLMEIVCETLCELKFDSSVENIRRRIDDLVREKPKSEASPGKIDPFVKEKDAVRIARELCDLVEEQQRLVESLRKKDTSTWEETQKFLTVKTIEFTDDLSAKSCQIKETADQKSKAQKYRETKLDGLTGSLDSATKKREDLMGREEELLKELETVRSDISKESSHINDLSEEIKLVEESSAEVIGSLTFAESELKVKHNILAASLKAMDSVQDFFSEYTKKETGWSESHVKALVGMANSDSHQSAGRLFRVCVSHLELCVQEGDRVLKKIKFCDTELKTMRERAIQMQTLGLMDGEEEEEFQDAPQDFSFVEEGLARIQAQHDKATAQLETVIDDGLKTQAILDSEGIRDTNNVKLRMLIDRMNDFAEYLRDAKGACPPADQVEPTGPSTSSDGAPTAVEAEEASGALLEDVKADENNAEEYIEYLEQKLNPGDSDPGEYQVMLNSEEDNAADELDQDVVADLDVDEPEPVPVEQQESAAEQQEGAAEGEKPVEGEVQEEGGETSDKDE